MGFHYDGIELNGKGDFKVKPGKLRNINKNKDGRYSIDGMMKWVVPKKWARKGNMGGAYGSRELSGRPAAWVPDFKICLWEKYVVENGLHSL